MTAFKLVPESASPYEEVGERYIDAGYPAIPVTPGEKFPGTFVSDEWKPMFDWTRFCDRRPTNIEIEFWNAWPDAGVCVALGFKGLVAIDIDTDDSEIVAAIMAVLPVPSVIKRGAKGKTLFYRCNVDPETGCEVKSRPFDVRGERVLDLLAHGKQTVLPPTIHPKTGQPYIWLGTETLADVPVEQLPLLPDDIAERLAAALEPFGYTEPVAREYTQIEGSDSYWRDLNQTALANLGMWVRVLGLPKTRKSGAGFRAVAAWRGVKDTNLAFHPDGIKDWGTNEGYTPIDVVMLGLSLDVNEASEWLAEKLNLVAANDNVADRLCEKADKAAADDDDEQEDDSAINPPAAKVDAFDVSIHSGVLRKVSQYILDTARIPVPEFATIAAITFLSAFFGRRYVTPSELGLNIYMAGIAGPGFGKDHPRRVIEILGHGAGMGHLIGPNDVTSDSAIEKVVRRRPCFVMPFDEIGLVLQAMNDKNASWARSVRKSLLELYSKSTAVWSGKEKADDKKDSSGNPVWFPTVSVLGMSTPTEFYSGITEKNLSDGFMARLTVIEAKTAPKRKRSGSTLKTPAALVASLQKAYESVPSSTGNLLNSAARDAKQKPLVYGCEWGNGAEERWTEIEDWQLDTIEKRPDYEGLIGRTAEQTQKIATVVALSRDQCEPVVSIDDIEFGYSIVRRSIVTIDEGVRKHMSGSLFHALCNKLFEYIKAAGSKGIAKSVLMRKPGVNAAGQLYDPAIKYLAGAEKIKPTAGHGGVRYIPLRK
jgi:hypothetical protein